MSNVWWLWVAAGLALAIVEVVVPGWIFAGFALGAVLTGLLLLTEIWPAGWMGAGTVNQLLVFAVISLLCWLVLRLLLGVRKGQVKYWDRDINEN
ncbi:NfeD family protein [Plastorhodobacter daqingensis]|uniref:NfeD family protein n=1 Tax=Plastorhodobacter daqingensis TaxID=1387281 RepID=A0ABW2UR43_9RHOB